MVNKQSSEWKDLGNSRDKARDPQENSGVEGDPSSVLELLDWLSHNMQVHTKIWHSATSCLQRSKPVSSGVSLEEGGTLSW